jgi:hypothetical protein
MISTFRHSVEQTKIDALIGEKLLADTEKFFKNNEELRTMLKEYTPSLKQSIKRSNKRRETYIY